MDSIIFISELDDKLIELVCQNKVLYDLKDKNYKHNPTRQTVWKKVGSELGISGDDSEARWRTIHDYYRENVNKFKGNTTESPIPISTLKKLQFLDDTFKEKKKGLLINMTTNGSNQYQKLEETDEDNDGHENDKVDGTQEGITEVGLCGNVVEKKSDPGVEMKSVILDKIQDMQVQKNQMLSGALEKIVATTQKGQVERHQLLKDYFLRLKPEVKENMNPTDIFFKSMCDTTKTFPPHIVAETKLKICQIMNEMELKMIQDQNKQLLTSDTRTVKPNIRVDTTTYSSSNAAGSSSPSSFSTKVKRFLQMIMGKNSSD